jgi:hypothetical protein
MSFIPNFINNLVSQGAPNATTSAPSVKGGSSFAPATNLATAAPYAASAPVSPAAALGSATSAVPVNPMQQASGAQRGALAGTTAGMAYMPQNVYAGAQPNVNMGQYLNPYTQNVIGGLAQEAARGMQMGANQLGAQATKAGAFGGSRQAIAQGQMMGDIMRGLNQQTGQLLSSGYQQAQNVAQQDLNRRLQAQQLNQAADMQAAQQRMQAAAQLGALGQQSFGYGQQIQGGLAQQGQMQQAINQALIDAAKGQFAGYTGAPATSLGYMGNALGTAPTPTSTTGTGSQSNQAGLMDTLASGATIYSAVMM